MRLILKQKYFIYAPLTLLHNRNYQQPMCAALRIRQISDKFLRHNIWRCDRYEWNMISLFSKRLLCIGLFWSFCLLLLPTVLDCLWLSFIWSSSHLRIYVQEDNKTDVDQTHDQNCFWLNFEASTIFRKVAHLPWSFFSWHLPIYYSIFRPRIINN